MNLRQIWSMIRGRQTNFSWMNASWTYYPDGDPMTHGYRPKPSDEPPNLPTTGSGVKSPRSRETVTIYVPYGYKDAREFLRDCQFELAPGSLSTKADFRTDVK